MPDFLSSVISSEQMSIYEETYREFLNDRVIILTGEIGDNVIDDCILYILKWNKA